MPRILVTNDDGVHSDGIHALADALRPLGQVIVVAPHIEASAIGHALTLRRPLRMERLAKAGLRVRPLRFHKPFAIIAEIKRHSPSRGKLSATLDPARQARAYAAGGASVLSVLTEPSFFKGSLADLRAARSACELPVLRKDFLVDPYQVDEARAHGADGVLLLCSILDDATLRLLLRRTHRLGMFALVEASTRPEVGRAVRAGARVVGVNVRDLHTFVLRPGNHARWRRLIPPGRLAVAESGIRTPADTKRLRRLGYDAALVGESLVRSPDPASTVRSLLAR